MTQKIYLSQQKFALVDDEDYENLQQFNWSLHVTAGSDYAKHIIKGTNLTELMHRRIMNAIKGQEIDHINGNGLDNRKSNLRIVTHQQNLMNQKKTRGISQFKGVTWDKSRKKWMARIKLNRKTINLGRFETEKEASDTYDKASIQYFGKYAKPNMGVLRE